MIARRPPVRYAWRRRAVAGVLLLAMLGLAGRAAQLQFAEREFLQSQGDSRQQRTVPIPAHRGMLLDRNGEPLAVSTPVASVWAEPARLLRADDRLNELARALALSAPELRRRLAARRDRQFLYLRRQVAPRLAERVRALQVPGVHLQTEYRRYYPMGAAAAQVLGTTDIDDRGREGLELSYDGELRGRAGSQRVRQDRHGRVLHELRQLRAPKHGRSLRLSLDRGLQYVAYRDLERAVRAHRARAGVLVLLDAVTGEVLALAQAPSFNPNDRAGARAEQRRSRAVTDLYEPGSVIKPFTVLAALMSGRYAEDSRIDTAPGSWVVDGHRIRDVRNFGELDLAGVLIKSSNVAAARLALAVPAPQWWGVLDGLGFGQALATDFPGAAVGVLRAPEAWMRMDQAGLGYGYGLSATPLHLAQAFAVLANRGVRHAPSFRAAPAAAGRRVLPPEMCARVLRMLERVARAGGTAWRARLPGYTVAAKTGTVRKLGEGGYSDRRHVAMIAGIVPARHPRLVMLVLIDEPQGGRYYGGEVAAPVFQGVAWEAVRVLNIPPDDPDRAARAAAGAGAG